YIPSISGGEGAILTAATGMKTAGMLLPGTDLADLSRKAWAKLDGVSDDWLKTLEVERLADGQIPPDQAQRLAIELATIGTPFLMATCCSPASKFAK
ncbi:MAG TPA: myristoyl transferase, partial [Chthoniobacteraceae bacterium]